MNNNWHRVASRDGVDITTVSIIDETFYHDLWNFIGTEKEVLFTFFEHHKFSHFVNVNWQEFGRFLYHKYLFSEEQIEQCYQDGAEFVANAENQAERWRNLFTKQNNISN